MSWSYTGDRTLLKNFTVSRAASESGPYQVVRTMNETAYTDTKLVNGQTYWYQVTANDRYGATAASVPVAVTPIQSDTQAPVAMIALKDVVVAVGDELVFDGGASTDNDTVISWLWNFGDGESDAGQNCRHSYAAAGEYTVTLQVADECGNSAKATAAVTVIDLNETTEYVRASIQVVDTTTTQPIPRAEIFLTNETGSMDIRLVTDYYGKATLLLKIGSYKAQVMAGGYLLRSSTILVSEEQQNITIGLSASSVLAGELTVTEMSYDEIIAAGIDATDPDNQHVYRFATVLEFQPEPERSYTLPIDYYCNNRGKVLSSWGSTSGSGTGSEGGGSGVYFNCDDLGLTVYPVHKGVI